MSSLCITSLSSQNKTDSFRRRNGQCDCGAGRSTQSVPSGERETMPRWDVPHVCPLRGIDGRRICRNCRRESRRQRFQIVHHVDCGFFETPMRTRRWQKSRRPQKGPRKVEVVCSEHMIDSQSDVTVPEGRLRESLESFELDEFEGHQSEPPVESQAYGCCRPSLPSRSLDRRSLDWFVGD